MKKLTQAELSEMEFKDSFSRKMKECSRLFREYIKNLEIGESVMVTKDEWTLKSPPAALLSKNKMLNLSTRTLKDGSGWVVTRN